MGLPEPNLDIVTMVRIEALKRKAEETGPMDLMEMFERNRASGGRDALGLSLAIDPCYLAMYTLSRHEGKVWDQLSVSCRDGLMDMETMEKFTVAFGLGTRDAWMVNMPPRPPILRAYNVMVFRTR